MKKIEFIMKASAALVSALVLMTACQVMAKPPRYALTLKNGTTNMIEQAGIKFEGYKFDWGNFSPGRSKSDRMVLQPIPEKAVVYWKSRDGKQHDSEVIVKALLPKSFEGDITFIIKEDSVAVSHQPFFEMPKDWKVVPK